MGWHDGRIVMDKDSNVAEILKKSAVKTFFVKTKAFVPIYI